jgi:hypothetical protein
MTSHTATHSASHTPHRRVLILSVTALIAAGALLWAARAHARAASAIEDARHAAAQINAARAALQRAEVRPITALSTDDPAADGISRLHSVLASLSMNPDDPATNIRLTTTDSTTTRTTPTRTRTITLEMPIPPDRLDALLTAMHTTAPTHAWTLTNLDVELNPTGPNPGPRLRASWSTRLLPAAPPAAPPRAPPGAPG